MASSSLARFQVLPQLVSLTVLFLGRCCRIHLTHGTELAMLKSGLHPVKKMLFGKYGRNVVMLSEMWTESTNSSPNNRVWMYTVFDRLNAQAFILFHDK